MSVIFNFSNQNGRESGSLSEEIITTAVTLFTDIKKDTPEMQRIVEDLSFPVRKLAHFTIYFILGFLIMNACYIWGIRLKTLIIAGIISTLFAISDEFHQSFISGRVGALSDVLLDASGALFAEYLYHYFIYLKRGQSWSGGL